MTSIPKLLAELENRGILLHLADGDIRYRSPKDALTAADRDTLRSRREDIRSYLLARAAAKALRNLKPAPGPLTPSVAQEMWWRFAGGAHEGEPFALNIAMVGKFHADPVAVTAALRQIIARYDALRVTFKVTGATLAPSLNAPDDFDIEQQDLRDLDAGDADAAAEQGAQEFCSQVNFIEGRWLTRAKVFALPGGETLAALSSAHMIADAGTRNIILDEMHDILEQGASRLSVPYNDYSLAERDFLAGPQGATLIDYWRRWYDAQPTMTAPSTGTPMLWGNGIRTVRNFSIPKQVMDRVRRLANDSKVTPFLIWLTIFSIALGRWSALDRFAVRVLGDKRTSLELANTVGLMFCADAVQIDTPPDQNFESIMRGILAEYDAALGLRIPTLHFYAPHCVRPGIEAPGFPNKIPAVFNYYSVGTTREKAQRQAAADTSVAWPPQITPLPPQTWFRPSSPVFLHVMDYGAQAAASLHFYADVVGTPDQERFVSLLFEVFAQSVPA